MTLRHVSRCGRGNLPAEVGVTKVPIFKDVLQPKVARTFYVALQQARLQPMHMPTFFWHP
ncbi:MAG TPA: hypothetical protein VFQ52_03420 [Rhizomicrobium sp.]|nr:hypothetical protein [Rhizomicrobium sp.]